MAQRKTDQIIRSRVNIKIEMKGAGKRATAQFEKLVDDALEDARITAEARILAAFSRPPGQPKHPIQWTSEKQRKYFWAVIAPKYMVNGEYQGYPRTNTLVRGWRVLLHRKPGGGLLSISNRVPYGRYVYGDLRNGKHAQRYHTRTGWPVAHPIVRVVRESAVTQVETTIRAAAPDRLKRVFTAPLGK